MLPSYSQGHLLLPHSTYRLADTDAVITLQQHWRKNEQHIHLTGNYKTHPSGSSRNKLPDGEEEKCNESPQMDHLIQSYLLLKFEQRLDVAFDVNDANAIFFSEIITTSGDIAFYPEGAAQCF